MMINEIPRLMSLRTGAQQPHINKGIVDGQEQETVVLQQNIVNDETGVIYPTISREVLRTDDGLVITAIAVDHGPVPAVAYRIEYKGHSIVYSGDTASNGPNMITISREADLLIHVLDVSHSNFRNLHEPGEALMIAAGIKENHCSSGS